MVFYDTRNQRLVFIGNKPTSKFWDDLWKDQRREDKLLSNKFDLLVSPTTKRYLKKGARVLEGGCGHGTYVKVLSGAGYDCVGVDFAKSTVKAINKNNPELDIKCADLKKLPFKSDSFDGYWSLGVIEHFYKGYKPILQEIKRVLKTNGYIFISFPYMSPVRKVKAKLGIYNKWSSRNSIKFFYQFALSDKYVIKEFEKNGFELIEKKPYDGFAGLRKEVATLAPILNPITNLSEKYLAFAALRFLISSVFKNVSSHSILLVFRKK